MSSSASRVVPIEVLRARLQASKNSSAANGGAGNSPKSVSVDKTSPVQEILDTNLAKYYSLVPDSALESTKERFRSFLISLGEKAGTDFTAPLEAINSGNSFFLHLGQFKDSKYDLDTTERMFVPQGAPGSERTKDRRNGTNNSSIFTWRNNTTARAGWYYILTDDKSENSAHRNFPLLVGQYNGRHFEGLHIEFYPANPIKEEYNFDQYRICTTEKNAKNPAAYSIVLNSTKYVHLSALNGSPSAAPAPSDDNLMIISAQTIISGLEKATEAIKKAKMAKKSTERISLSVPLCVQKSVESSVQEATATTTTTATTTPTAPAYSEEELRRFFETYNFIVNFNLTPEQTVAVNSAVKGREEGNILCLWHKCNEADLIPCINAFNNSALEGGQRAALANELIGWIVNLEAFKSELIKAAGNSSN